jgi:hypothetical protein
MPTDSSRTFTVRFPQELHESARLAAERSGTSLNALLQAATEAYLRAREEQELFDSFTLLGSDPEACDVEFAWEAQREAVTSVPRAPVTYPASPLP